MGSWARSSRGSTLGPPADAARPEAVLPARAAEHRPLLRLGLVVLTALPAARSRKPPTWSSPRESAAAARMGDGWPEAAAGGRAVGESPPSDRDGSGLACVGERLRHSPSWRRTAPAGTVVGESEGDRDSVAVVSGSRPRPRLACLAPSAPDWPPVQAPSLWPAVPRAPPALEDATPSWRPMTTRPRSSVSALTLAASGRSTSTAMSSPADTPPGPGGARWKGKRWLAATPPASLPLSAEADARSRFGVEQSSRARRRARSSSGDAPGSERGE
mmetsp:Transcript_21708/g.58464  ORF Transcript_21708/g.58464 Transcript_21708/m.58464 type:complete len:273 (+) Transcript_21708:289-1107(+)